MKKPTESELEILNFLWNKGPSTVKEIHSWQNESREVGYTTTLKIMQIMFEKGMLSRESLGRSHVYAAQMEQQKTQKNLLRNLAQSAFGGNAMKMVMQALGDHKASKEELKAIKDLIHKLEKE